MGWYENLYRCCMAVVSSCREMLDLILYPQKSLLATQAPSTKQFLEFQIG